MSSTPVVVELPAASLVVLVGASGSGKSAFAARHFQPTEVVSSDACRAMISDDPADQAVTHLAFPLLHRIVGLRLRCRRLTVVDATSLTPQVRRALVELAQRWDVPAVAVVLDVPEDVCHHRDRERLDRQVGPGVIAGHVRSLQADLDGLAQEGFARVYVLDGPEQVNAVVMRRTGRD